MTSATSLLFLVIHFACIRAGKSSDTFVNLECKTEHHGVDGQQSILECIVKSVDVTIKMVTWKRVGSVSLLLEYHADKMNSTPGFKLAEPSWNENNMNVSLLLTNTKMADKGEYECMVITDRGDDTAKTSLSVTATPTMSSIPETNINGAEFVPHVSGSKGDNLVSDSTTQWLAPVVVIGSLIIGLLAALLICKRRSAQRGHQTDTRHDQDVETEGLNSDSPQDQHSSL